MKRYLLLLSALLALSSPCLAAIGLANSAACTSGTTTVTNLQCAVPATAAGSTLVFMVATKVTDAGMVVTDSAGGTWSLGCSAAYSDNAHGAVYLFHSDNRAAGVTWIKVTKGSGSDKLTVVAAEVSGADPAPLDRCQGGASGYVSTGTWTSPPSGTIAMADELLIGAATQYYAQTATWTAGAGYSIFQSYVGDGSSRAALMAESRVVSSVGSYTASGVWSVSSGEHFESVIATFKSSGSPAPSAKTVRISVQ